MCFALLLRLLKVGAVEPDRDIFRREKVEVVGVLASDRDRSAVALAWLWSRCVTGGAEAPPNRRLRSRAHYGLRPQYGGLKVSMRYFSCVSFRSRYPFNG